jgi:hypothetical protein
MSNTKKDDVNMHNYIMVKDDCGLTDDQVAQRRADEKSEHEDKNSSKE